MTKPPINNAHANGAKDSGSEKPSFLTMMPSTAVTPKETASFNV